MTTPPAFSPVDAAGEWLTPPERMAIGYAPRALRPAWSGLLAFDRRLADAARDGREAIMIQLRLAWWRDRLAEPAERRPRGEPLLALLGAWDDERGALGALVDGWEAQVVGEDGGAALDRARAGAIVALARMAGLDISPHITAAASDWAEGRPLSTGALPRALRPLVLLQHFESAKDLPPWRILAGALRKGWLGR
jgi:15-cis-phytoene synthase